MNRLNLLLVLLVSVSCGGSVTEEQRKQMAEAREQQAIVRVTEAEILDAAFTKGRQVVAELQENLSDQQRDSVQKEFHVRINWLAAGTTDASEIEQQLIEAYLNSVMMGEEQHDNVQRIGSDSLLYTRAVVVTRPDNSVEVKGTWNIWLSKKQLILSMPKK